MSEINPNESTQSEKREVLRNDTYFARQQNTIDDAGGRFTKLTQALSQDNRKCHNSLHPLHGPKERTNLQASNLPSASTLMNFHRTRAAGNLMLLLMSALVLFLPPTTWAGP